MAAVPRTLRAIAAIIAVFPSFNIVVSPSFYVALAE
jgi:hypothetical protein